MDHKAKWWFQRFVCRFHPENGVKCRHTNYICRYNFRGEKERPSSSWFQTGEMIHFDEHIFHMVVQPPTSLAKFQGPGNQGMVCLK